VVPSAAFEALFTTTALAPPDDEVVLAGAVLACEEEPDLLELLPHPASASEATSAGRRNFKDERIRDSFGQRNETIGRSTEFTEVA
jgi:hypothetical protein